MYCLIGQDNNGELNIHWYAYTKGDRNQAEQEAGEDHDTNYYHDAIFLDQKQMRWLADKLDQVRYI
jgi:hypothetical protein